MSQYPFPLRRQGVGPAESPTAKTRGSGRGWIVATTVIGTTIEWYDFFIYGTAAALVFNKIIFPTFDPVAGTMAAFATFAIGLIVRPFGGIIFGHFGDRVGRKTTLMVSLLLMGIPTTLIGLVPTYNSIGLWAAAILVPLRILQGFALGGEWGGAVLMAVEHAPKSQRAFYGALPQAGIAAGLLLSSLPSRSSAPCASHRSSPGVGGCHSCSASSWSWSACSHDGRSPSPQPSSRSCTPARRSPYPASLSSSTTGAHSCFAIGAKLGEVTLFYLATVFALSYATTKLGMPRQQVLNAIMIAAALACMTIPLFGVIGDRFGQRRVFAIGALYLAAFAVPMFWMMDSRQPALFLLAIIGALAICQPSMYALLPSLYAAQFPAEIRCSGVSLCFQIAAAIGGGVAPIAATWLLVRFGTTLPIAVYLVGLGLLAAICAASMQPVHPVTFPRLGALAGAPSGAPSISPSI